MKHHATFLILGIAALTTLALFAIATDAEAAVTKGCARIDHASGTSHRYYKLATGGEPTASDACTNGATWTMDAGECVTWDADHATSGATPPAAAGFVWIYVFADTAQKSHGSTGRDEWANPLVRITGFQATTFDGFQREFCATDDATSSGNPRAGTYRIVIRACLYTPNMQCDNGTSARVFDINSDTGGDDPGTANTIAGESEAAYVGKLAPSCVKDEITSGAGNTDTYPLRTARRLEMCAQQAVANTGVEDLELEIMAEDGTTSLDASTSTLLRTGATASATWSASTMTSARGYVVGDIIIKRYTITGNSALLGEPWTRWGTSPAGTTITGTNGEVLSADMGLVTGIGEDKDPLTIAATYDAAATELLVTTRSAWLNGTARAGLDEVIYVRIYTPSDAAFAGGPWTVTETTTPGVYRVRISLGASPAVGAWIVTADTVQPDNAAENVTASATFLVTVDLAARLTELRDVLSYLSGRVNTTTSGLALESTLTTTRDLVITQGAKTRASVNVTANTSLDHVTARSEYTNTRANDTSAYTNARLNDTMTYANTLTNGTLTATTWTDWRDGDLTTLWGTVNGTARQRTLIAVENDTNGALAAIYEQSHETNQYLAGYWIAQTWDVIKPPTRELGGLLGLGALMVGTGVYHVRGERLRRAGAARWRAQSVIAGATLLAVYLWSVSPA